MFICILLKYLIALYIIYYQDHERWKAVRFSLRSGIRAAFDPDVTPDVIEIFDSKVDAVFKKYGIIFPE